MPRSVIRVFRLKDKLVQLNIEDEILSCHMCHFSNTKCFSRSFAECKEITVRLCGGSMPDEIEQNLSNVYFTYIGMYKSIYLKYRMK